MQQSENYRAFCALPKDLDMPLTIKKCGMVKKAAN
jgi:hypothetical protein